MLQTTNVLESGQIKAIADIVKFYDPNYVYEVASAVAVLEAITYTKKLIAKCLEPIRKDLADGNDVNLGQLKQIQTDLKILTHCYNLLSEAIAQRHQVSCDILKEIDSLL